MRVHAYFIEKASYIETGSGQVFRFWKVVAETVAVVVVCSCMLFEGIDD